MLCAPLADHEHRSRIGDRIVEVPVDAHLTERTSRRASRRLSRMFPVGSIAKGEALVTTGGARLAGGKIVAGKTGRVQHLPWRGPHRYADMPPIAGRSPSYLVQADARHAEGESQRSRRETR